MMHLCLKYCTHAGEMRSMPPLLNKLIRCSGVIDPRASPVPRQKESNLFLRTGAGLKLVSSDPSWSGPRTPDPSFLKEKGKVAAGADDRPRQNSNRPAVGMARVKGQPRVAGSILQ